MRTLSRRSKVLAVQDALGRIGATSDGRGVFEAMERQCEDYWLHCFGNGLIDDMWVRAISVELHRTGEARYMLRLLGARGPITIAIWTTRKSMIRAEHSDERPPWVALSTGPDTELQSLTADHCDFHFEHVNRDQYMMGFARHDQSWYMTIVAGGYIKIRVVPSPEIPMR